MQRRFDLHLAVNRK